MEKFNNFFYWVNIKFYNYGCGAKGSGTSAYLISSLRPTPRSKKCPRTDGENPDL